MQIKSPQARQADLDALGVRMRWQRAHFRTWKVRGYTVGMAAHGYPRMYIVAKGAEREFLDDLEDVVGFVLSPERSRA